MIIHWRRLKAKIPSVSSEELALSRLTRCELSRLRCNGHNLLLFSYQCRIKRKNSFLQCLRTSSKGSYSPPPGLSCIRARHLWHYFFHFRPLVQTLGCSCWVSSEFLRALFLKRGRIAPCTTIKKRVKTKRKDLQ